MTSDSSLEFLPERGEMAQRLRGLDWSATPLGAPGTWPQNLRAALSLCLSSRFPILIWWGQDFRILYNDAYIPFLGANKHPAALAQPGQECWREIWGAIGPMLEGVYRSGQATWSHDAQYFFDRNLPREEVYVTFTYGPSALRSPRLQPPDLIISDVMMPGMDGLSLLQALRGDERTRSVPVILLSARAGEEARVEGMLAGADDYLIKPFAARELQARVDAHLRLALLRREAHAALRASEQRLRAIIEQLPVGVGVCDPSGGWILANAIMERYAPDAVPSARAAQAAHWRGWDESGNPVAPENWPGRRALRGEMVMPGTEMQYTAADGREHWMRVSAAPRRAAAS
ncbi:response regulator [Achromobacter denitrificans]